MKAGRLTSNDADLFAEMFGAAPAGRPDAPKLELISRFPSDPHDFETYVRPIYGPTISSNGKALGPAPGEVLAMDITGGPADAGPFALVVETDLAGEVVITSARPDEGFEVAVTLTCDGESVSLDAVTFRPIGSDRSLPTSALARRLLDGELRRQVEQVAADPWLGRRLGVTWARYSMRPKRTGRKGTSDVFYATWARRYVRALDSPDTKASPVKHLAETHGYANGSVRQYLDRARRRGLLTKPPEGRRQGGALTEKALELLSGIPEED